MKAASGKEEKGSGMKAAVAKGEGSGMKAAVGSVRHDKEVLRYMARVADLIQKQKKIF